MILVLEAGHLFSAKVATAAISRSRDRWAAVFEQYVSLLSIGRQVKGLWASVRTWVLCKFWGEETFA